MGKRLMVVFTETMYVDVSDEEATRLCDANRDYMDVIEAACRWRRAAAHSTEHLEHEVTVNVHDDDFSLWGITAINGDDREKWLWSARHFVTEARQELIRGRYREGNCADMDRVCRDLGRVDEELRQLAIQTDRAVTA